jgi:hypothetical protein
LSSGAISSQQEDPAGPALSKESPAALIALWELEDPKLLFLHSFRSLRVTVGWSGWAKEAESDLRGAVKDPIGIKRVQCVSDGPVD